MNILGWLELAIYLIVLLVITKPLGIYLVQVLDTHGKTFLDPVVKPVEKLTYRLFGVDPEKEQSWLQYTIAMLVFTLVTVLFTYVILRLQGFLPLNQDPKTFQAVTDHVAFNTAVSFSTNTNWQSYSGESTMTYFSQMVGLAVHNFMSAAVGIAVAAAVVRGIARHTAKTLGNFWVDLVRITYYLLLPICFFFAMFLVWQGVPQNFKPYQTAKVVEAQKVQVQKKDANGNPVNDAKGNPVMEEQTVDSQTVTEGPMASQMAIKMLGTNGGGFVNANAAHPFENPTPLSNFIQMLSIFAIPSALTYYLGRMVKSQKHGWAVWMTMALVFVVGFIICWGSEAAGNPQVAALGVSSAGGNMEGKEVRFGITNSALFATITTDASCGAVNAAHDSFTPIGGLIPMLNIQLGEIIFGGVGAGLYGMILFVVLAVFIAGLMVGRTPEYLGKKIESYDVKMAAFGILLMSFSILGFSAWASVSDWGQAGRNNMGPHGLSEILYAFTSCTGNNGSAFAGLTAAPTNGDPHYDITLAFAMLIGRFGMIIPVMALAGSLARKKLVATGAGTFPVSGPIFIVLLIGTILLVGALTFFPALSLGPILEHFQMYGGKTY
ncbi:MAG TPA: potassium-transporting ATPase subunit KdpA [Chthoniobacterales bacterium]|jgi:potassium-transporting ATPase potassium-binding subunit|nr:potassium-transporting ATPase subunit KdpA [Chthoniobacterales bacterium]